ncbi:type II secretion system GspH family protein [bacterium]|nr:type II secretion system GspH family protein [bacterium]MBU1994456.1 type II secretion system GspH family protein [bacterium]
MKKAFSLVELLIVVLIIGIVYNLAITNFNKIEENATKLTLQNLKEYLQQFPHAKSVKLVCLDDCSSCDVFVDGEKQKGLEGFFDDFIDESIKVYRYDFLLGAVSKLQDVYFNEEDVEEKVCFSYAVDRQGVGEQVLIEYDKAVYDFTSYLTLPPKYNSLGEALTAKRKIEQEVLR